MIGIVGAGITGLALAHHLGRLGVDHVVLEADDRAGGVIQTITRGGVVLDLGPQRTRLIPEVRELVDDLDLSNQLVTAPRGLPFFVYRRGDLHRVPLTPARMLASDVMSWGGKARLLAEPFTRGPDAYETVESFLVRKLGRELYEGVVGPLYGSFYSSDPARMMVRHQAKPLTERLGGARSLVSAWIQQRSAGPRVPPCSFGSGMQTLIDALLQAASGRVHLSTPVRRIGREGLRRFRLETDDGPFDVRTVVLTTPARSAAALLRNVAPDAARRLVGLTYNPVAMVHLESDCPLRGVGYQMAFGEGLETRGVTFNQSLFGRDRLFTASLGGMWNPGLVDLPDDRIGAVARDEFRHVTGHDARVLYVHRAACPAWDVTWRSLEGLTLPPDLRICSNYLGRPGITGRLRQARRVAYELARDEGAQVA